MLKRLLIVIGFLAQPAIAQDIGGAGIVFSGSGSGSGSGGLSNVLTQNYVFQGNASNIATGVTLSAAIDAALGSTQGSILYRGSGAWVILAPGTNGYFLETQGAAANPMWAAQAGSTGCVVSGGSQYQILVNNGSSGCSSSANGSLQVGALTLGTNTSAAGSVALANAGGSGASVTIQNPSATSAYNFNLPATAGSVGSLFVSGGGSSAANAWVPDVATGSVLISGGTTSIPSYASTLPSTVQGNITTVGTVASGTWNASVIGSSYGGAGNVIGILKANGSGTVSAAVSGTDYAPASGDISIVTLGTITTGTWNGTPIGTGYGGTGCTSPTVTCFNNITGYSASGATGTTSTNLVFSTSPQLTAPTIVAGSTLNLSAAGTLGIATNAGANTVTVGQSTSTVALPNVTVSGTENVTGHVTFEGVTSTGATGTGNLVFGTSPTIATAALGSSTATTQAALTNNTTVATTAYADSAVAAATNNFDIKNPVAAATTAALSFSPTYSNGASGVGATLTGSVGVLIIDGYTPALNDRLMVKNQATTFQNGIYSVTTLGTVSVGYVLTRTTDFNSTATIIYGDSAAVLNGTANANQQFTQSTTGAITVGSTAIVFVQSSGGSQLTAGTGIAITGNQVAVSSATLLNPASPVQHGILIGGSANQSTVTAALGAGNFLQGASSADPVASAFTLPTSIAAHQTLVATGTTTVAAKTVPDCTDTGGNHINYTQSGDTWSCGTSSGGGSTNYQSFTSSGTWTKPAGVTVVLIECLPGGGGGGGGDSSGATGGDGGAGGGGGSYASMVVAASAVGSTVTATVGAGGTGGAGSTSNAGADGTSGGTSSFGSFLSCKGGSFGGGSNGAIGQALGGPGATPLETTAPNVIYATTCDQTSAAIGNSGGSNGVPVNGAGGIHSNTGLRLAGGRGTSLVCGGGGGGASSGATNSGPGGAALGYAGGGGGAGSDNSTGSQSGNGGGSLGVGSLTGGSGSTTGGAGSSPSSGCFGGSGGGGGQTNHGGAGGQGAGGGGGGGTSGGSGGNYTGGNGGSGKICVTAW